jgi:hypothetical protein
MNLPPWAEGPFEIILHGELHYRGGEDFDRRMALISFDNAIEVAIATYLSLNPIQRQGRSYPRADVDRWNTNFHAKLDFWECECTTRSIEVRIERSHVVWYHDLRNRQYHEGSPSTPNLRDLKGIREAALWIFSELYEVTDAEQVLNERIGAMTAPTDKPPRDAASDKTIDSAYGLVEVADSVYYTSELLHSFDPVAYKEIALELSTGGSRAIRAVS